MGMYERAMLHLAAKEQKLNRTAKELTPTFTPETNKTKLRSHSGSNIIADRLSKKSTPGKANHGRSFQKRSPTSVSTRSWGSTPSSHIDQLYRDGLRRAQNRAPTDRQDEEQRRKRLEEKELEQCTFRPNMDWRKKKKPLRVDEKPSPNWRKDLPPSHSLRTHRSRDSPPVHVITTRAESRHGVHFFASPPRGEEITDRTYDSNGTESVEDNTEYGSI